MRTFFPLALVSLSLGCKAKDPDPQLEAFSSCDSMERYIRAMARDEAQYDFAWGGLGFGATENSVISADAGGDSGGAEPPQEESASSYSGTNLQEAEVDEDDVVKTDGTYIYALSGDYLMISKAFPTEDAALISQIAVDGSPRGIYLIDDYVVAISQVTGGSSGPSPRSGDHADREADAYTLATVVDVSDRSSPVVVRETYASGAFEATRRIGDRLYVVTYEEMRLTDGAESLSDARRMIRDLKSTEMLPWRMDNVLRSATWSVDKGPACDCTDVYASETETGTYVTNVLSLDLDDPLSEFEGEAVVGRADTVYASTEAVYVGYSEWTDDEGYFVSVDDQLDSVVHKFDISEGAAHPTYVATAKVPGQMYSQFALSEYDDVLRIATTEVDEDWQSSASVRTLSMSQGQSTVLSELTGLAPDEGIFAVRFVRDIGYIVTYAQEWGDPLFTLDLSDPSDIRLAGELAVTGFSNYLHPMDDGHLLAVGMDEDVDGWQLAVSIFDVSDIYDPQLSTRMLLEASSSEAQSDHHAFNYFAEKEVLAIPSTTWEGDSVLEVIHATTDTLESLGRISQASVLDDAGLESWCAPVRRSVVMDDDLWAVSEVGLTAAAILEPETIKATVPFIGTTDCSFDYDEEW